MPDTEAEVVADLATQALPRMAQMDLGPRGNVHLVATRTPDGGESLHLVDESPLDDGPSRPKGTITVTDAASFVQAVQQRRLDSGDGGSYGPPVVYADEAAMAIIAVLNDDHMSVTGYRDYQIRLALQRTVEWERWLALDDKLVAQDRFADHIDRSVRDIEEPDAATMLEVAQKFEATTLARFSGGTEIRTGARTIQYVEKVEQGSASGAAGAIELPEMLALGIQPFYGSVTRNADGAWVPARVRVEASLRFKIRDENLSIGYRIVDPHEIERHAWRRIAEQISEGLELTHIAGPVPSVASGPGAIVSNVYNS